MDTENISKIIPYLTVFPFSGFLCTMKDQLNRTKVVIRHLPPSISKSALMEQINPRFFGRYNWLSFRHGKISQKNQHHSRAYINFQSPGDVVEFAEFFDGHIFVNEKGSQFKAHVEYSPSQSGPKLSSKKDGREGTIFKDPEYVQFLEFIAKHENLPSAEIQLERREAERAGGPKEPIIVTPLMNFIRQKRAIKSRSQRSSVSGKLSRRSGGTVSSSFISSKRGREKRRGPTSMYVVRDSAKAGRSWKDKSTYMLASGKEDQQSALANRTETSEAGAVVELNGTIPVASRSVEIEKRRVVLLKGKERDASHISSVSTQQQNTTASVGNIAGSISSKQNQQRDVSGGFIRTILSRKDITTGLQHDQLTEDASCEREKRPPRPPKPRLPAFSSIPYNDGKKSLDDKAAVNNQHGSTAVGDKNEKRMRNKDGPHLSDGIHLSDDTYLSYQQLSESLEGISLSQQTVGHDGGCDDMGLSDIGGRGSKSRAGNDAQLNHGEIQVDLRNSDRNVEYRSGCADNSAVENGIYRNVGRRGLARGMKEVDISVSFSEAKLSKRGASAGYGTHERRIWVQKLGSGT